ncbi:MAG TPA: biopolymer transporter ExbD [Candidatus Krumholzibacteria bacterium]|nr:biopolymer transporter ExbD [Candidatus Krumholzibacteria bacterium]HRX50479.1 biopolymer transporter ExbD [Candidatus Krumholzibacteria bacterium]
MKRSRYRSLSEINITSLVDVTLCLLIIFMLTAPYIQGGVEVDLPDAETREVVVEEGPIISVTNNRQVFWEEEPVSLEDLEARLTDRLDERETLPVYLRIDQEIPYGFALRVMAVVERLGFQHLSLVADQEGADGSAP